MSGEAETAERFLALHPEQGPLLLPNASDAGSAKLLASLGFHDFSGEESDPIYPLELARERVAAAAEAAHAGPGVREGTSGTVH